MTTISHRFSAIFPWLSAGSPALLPQQQQSYDFPPPQFSQGRPDKNGLPAVSLKRAPNWGADGPQRKKRGRYVGRVAKRSRIVSVLYLRPTAQIAPLTSVVLREPNHLRLEVECGSQTSISQIALDLLPYVHTSRPKVMFLSDRLLC